LGGASISESHISTILDIEALACERGGETLFSGLSFSIKTSNLYWLKGQNGRGKTSLLRTIVGLLAPHTGSIAWQYIEKSDIQAERQPFLFIGHTNSLKDELTTLEALTFLANLGGVAADGASILAALDVFQMAHRRDTKIRMLSQGQRRRVALSRLALSPSPILWVLDEPFDALDDQGCRIVTELMQKHMATGGSVLLTSHTAVAMDSSNVTILELPTRARH
jgi:heme exporter protein A